MWPGPKMAKLGPNEMCNIKLLIRTMYKQQHFWIKYFQRINAMLSYTKVTSWATFSMRQRSVKEFEIKSINRRKNWENKTGRKRSAFISHFHIFLVHLFQTLILNYLQMQNVIKWNDIGGLNQNLKYNI